MNPLTDMAECAIINRCSFFREYGKDEQYAFALEGFLRQYCQGHRESICMRKMLADRFGSPDFVPANMLPNGLPVSGTSTESWPESAKRIRNVDCGCSCTVDPTCS